MIRFNSITRSVLPLGAALALAACGGEPEETTYEAGAEDLGGGELIVTQEDPNAVPVDTPDTPMTAVPDDEQTDGVDSEGDYAGDAEPIAD